jgi:DNA-binding NarL/FixJ family response regulator
MAAISVLLVDDNPMFRRIATSFLEEESGREVTVVGTAGGGEEALAQAETLRPEVVVMDLRMPGLSGLETIPRLRRLVPEARIIVLTLFDGQGYRKASFDAGAHEFVGKARMGVDLLPAIRGLVSAGRLPRIRAGQRRAADAGPDAGRPGGDARDDR